MLVHDHELVPLKQGGALCWVLGQIEPADFSFIDIVKAPIPTNVVSIRIRCMRKYTLCQVENVIFELLCLSGGQNLSIESPSRIVLVLDRPKKVLRRKIRICACAYPRLL